MNKSRAMFKGTSITLLTALAFIMIVWAHGRSAPAPAMARAGTDSVRAIKLRLTFAAGDSANVTEVEGGLITIEKNGKKLAISPHIRDRGQVELQVFQAIQREGKEVMQTLDTMLVDKNSTKLSRNDLLSSVQVLDSDKRLPVEALATPAATCCARTCAGTLVCGLCVCTDCGFCATVHWCDCNPPGPTE